MYEKIYSYRILDKRLVSEVIALFELLPMKEESENLLNANDGVEYLF